jgi:hypothetical protein
MEKVEEASPLKQKGPQHRTPSWLLLAAIFLISSGLIALEILLSRILSVVLSYHYVFVVLSIAMFTSSDQKNPTD